MSEQPRYKVSGTFKSASYSSSSMSINGKTTSREQATFADPSGTKVYRKMQNAGEAPVEEQLEYDSAGRHLQDAGPATAIEGGRVEDVTDADEERQRELDRMYKERMEIEYAKREGSA